jgi:hypothetical protein
VALDDVLDETRWRWPRPDGLEFRRSASDDEPTIEVVRRRRGGFGEMAVVVLSMLPVIASVSLLTVAVPGIVITQTVRRRRAQRRGEVVLAVRADQFRLDGTLYAFEGITGIESAGTLHGELWIRCGQHVVGKFNAERDQVDFLARWLTSLRGEAEEARALKKHYWRSL